MNGSNERIGDIDMLVMHLGRCYAIEIAIKMYVELKGAKLIEDKRGVSITDPVLLNLTSNDTYCFLNIALLFETIFNAK